MVVVQVMVMAVVGVAYEIRSILFNRMFGGRICGVGTGDGFNGGCGRSSLAFCYHL